MSVPVCPRCGARVAVRLADGEICPDCRCATAWQRYDRPGSKLVVDAEAIAEAEQRRAGEAAGESPWHRARRLLPTAIAAVLALAMLPFLAGLLRPAALAPLEEVLASFRSLSRATALLGLLALAAAVVALIRLRRGRLFRAWPLLAVNFLALVAGSVGLLVGGLHWAGVSGGLRDIYGAPWRYARMPPLRAAPAPSSLARAVMAATTVILASDEQGDMRGMALGTGAVIGRAARRAFVLTNSHVAMPYKTPAAFRDPAAARPVLVYFSDGRRAEGRVAWVSGPPLDAAVLSVPLDDPPAPVEVALDAGELGAGDRVFFVPNPFRRGWRTDYGEVSQRRTHAWPAGLLTLIYTTLSLEPGDSGSGLFDDRGRLIGINTWAQFDEDRKAGVILSKGISLPAETLQRIMDLIASERLDRLDTQR